MTTPEVYNVLLGEDEDLERRAMQKLVEDHLPTIQLVGAAATAAELLICTRQKQARSSSWPITTRSH